MLLSLLDIKTQNGLKSQNFNGERMIRKQITVENGVILTVEKGNADKPVERPVCAFTVADNIKVLLKGQIAAAVYDTFLKDKGTVYANENWSDEVHITKNVYVSFTGVVREERRDCTVVEEITDLKFSYDFEIYET